MLEDADGAADGALELRARVVDALDRGELARAEGALADLVRRAPGSVGAVGLSDVIRSVTGTRPLAAHPFANVVPLRVSELPPPTPAVAKLPRVLTTTRVFAEPHNRWRELRDEPYPHAIVKFDIDDPSVHVRAFLPRRLANDPLVLARPSDGRWIATYGRGHADARFVAILTEDGRAERVLDFAAWRGRNQIAEAGVAWAELEGSTLYVKTEIVAGDGFLAAIDLDSGQTRWRSERVAFASNFAIGDDRLAVWANNPRSILLAIDKATGATRARSEMGKQGFPNALLVAEGFVEAHGVTRAKPNEVLRLDVPATRPRPPLPRGNAAPMPREALPAAPLEEAARSKRLEGWAKLDAGDPVAAMVDLRDVLEQSPTNFATEALFTIARETAARARQQADADVRAIAPVVVSPGTPVGRAPVARGAKPPALRLLEEQETRRHPSAWFAENQLAFTMFSRDPSPSPFPVNIEPTWLPSTLDGSWRITDVAAPDHAVAVYEGGRVVVFRERRPVAVLDTSRVGTVLFADVLGDVAFLAVHAREPSIVAVDTKTGAELWVAKNIAATSFVFSDGYLIAAHAPLRGMCEFVVLEGDTGKVVSRVRSKSDLARYRLVLEGKRLYAFETVMSAKLEVR